MLIIFIKKEQALSVFCDSQTNFSWWTEAIIYYIWLDKVICIERER